MVENIIQNCFGGNKDYIFGFADLRGLLKGIYQEYLYGIVIGKRLDDSIIDAISNGPTLEYYHYYRQINTELSEVAHQVSLNLINEGIECNVFEPTFTSELNNDKEYLQTLSLEVSHKMIGTRAGLGWIGKTDLFVSKKFGTRVRLVSILTKQQLKTLNSPINESRCGKCDICVVKCPAQAANGKLWDIKVHRDEFFNAHKCREKCSELTRKNLNIDARICGICVSVCPVGMKRELKHL